MRRLCLITLFLSLLLASSAGAATPVTVLAGAPTSPIVRALLWQADQYTYIKTIHFVAVGHTTGALPSGKKLALVFRYEFWGAGRKYRIDYRQYLPKLQFSLVVTQNGKHFRYFGRNQHFLSILPKHPSVSGVPSIPNPILYPLIPLVPYPNHADPPHVSWLNFARFARNPQSILSRCRKIVACGKAGPGHSLRGHICGAVGFSSGCCTMMVAGTGGSHPLLTGWTATVRKPLGDFLRLGLITYKVFQLVSGRKITLPVAFAETAGGTRSMPGQPKTAKPMNLGTISMIRQVSLKPDDVAPPFALKMFNGHGTICLAQLRGKFVLLDFWASWYPSCHALTPLLKKNYARFGKSGKLMIVSITFDTNLKMARAFVAAEKIPWVEATAEDTSGHSIGHEYACDNIPALFLIRPDGKVIGSDFYLGSYGHIESVITQTIEGHGSPRRPMSKTKPVPPAHTGY